MYYLRRSAVSARRHALMNSRRNDSMLGELLRTPGKGVAEQQTYWAHTYLPFSRWRKATNDVVAEATATAVSFGISGAAVDRRRAYQVARMVVPNRHGEHLADLTPDAYNSFSPTSCAKSHSGKKPIAAPADRRAAYVRHPQTLAYLLTPVSLARQGVGGSEPGTVVGVSISDAAPSAGAIASDLSEKLGGKGGADVDRFAKVIAALSAKPQDEKNAA
jgi:hypothetical protein